MLVFLTSLLYCNDPSAGSPTETLLRLLLPLDRYVCLSSLDVGVIPVLPGFRYPARLQQAHVATQSVGATGGVYKGQGRNQGKLLTCPY